MKKWNKQGKLQERKQEKRADTRKTDENDMIDIIEGRNAVIEALKSGRDINKILVQEGGREGSIIKILAMAREKRIVIQYVEKNKLDSISLTRNHQGIIAYVPPYEYSSIEGIFKNALNKGEDPFIILLDEIFDPHNLGSIMRTADAVGAHGIIIPKRRAVGITSTVAKISAGAIEYVPVARVSNLAQTIDILKERGLWITGIDMQGETSFYGADLKGPIGLVIGNEGYGLGRLIKEKCDFLINIPMKGKIDSLNASIACSVIMYEVVRQRGG